jgi:hypothetical protein
MPRRRRSREEIEKEVLEAEKVVMSNMLYRWKKRYGMDYVIIVRNGPGRVFSRSSVDRAHKEDILSAIEHVRDRIDPMESWVVRPQEPEPEDKPEKEDDLRWAPGSQYRVQGRDGPFNVQLIAVDENEVATLKHLSDGHISRVSLAALKAMVVYEACPWCGSLEGYDESENREPRCVECWGSW